MPGMALVFWIGLLLYNLGTIKDPRNQDLGVGLLFGLHGLTSSLPVENRAVICNITQCTMMSYVITDVCLGRSPIEGKALGDQLAAAFNHCSSNDDYKASGEASCFPSTCRKETASSRV